MHSQLCFEKEHQMNTFLHKRVLRAHNVQGFLSPRTFQLKTFMARYGLIIRPHHFKRTRSRKLTTLSFLSTIANETTIEAYRFDREVLDKDDEHESPCL